MLLIVENEERRQKDDRPKDRGDATDVRKWGSGWGRISTP